MILQTSDWYAYSTISIQLLLQASLQHILIYKFQKRLLCKRMTDTEESDWLYAIVQ